MAYRTQQITGANTRACQGEAGGWHGILLHFTKGTSGQKKKKKP